MTKPTAPTSTAATTRGFFEYTLPVALRSAGGEKRPWSAEIFRVPRDVPLAHWRAAAAAKTASAPGCAAPSPSSRPRAPTTCGGSRRSPRRARLSSRGASAPCSPRRAALARARGRVASARATPPAPPARRRRPRSSWSSCRASARVPLRSGCRRHRRLRDDRRARWARRAAHRRRRARRRERRARALRRAHPARSRARGRQRRKGAARPSCPPRRPVVRAAPFAHELVFDRAAARWCGRHGESAGVPRVFLYPLHVSSAFLMTSGGAMTLPASLYLATLHLMAHDYAAAAALMPACQSDVRSRRPRRTRSGARSRPRPTRTPTRTRYASRSPPSAARRRRKRAPSSTSTCSRTTTRDLLKLNHVSVECVLTSEQELLVLRAISRTPPDVAAIDLVALPAASMANQLLRLAAREPDRVAIQMPRAAPADKPADVKPAAGGGAGAPKEMKKRTTDDEPPRLAGAKAPVASCVFERFAARISSRRRPRRCRGRLEFRLAPARARSSTPGRPSLRERVRQGRRARAPFASRLDDAATHALFVQVLSGSLFSMTANVQLGDKAKDVDAPPLLVLYAWLRGSLRAAKGADAGASAAVEGCSSSSSRSATTRSKGARCPRRSSGCKARTTSSLRGGRASP